MVAGLLSDLTEDQFYIAVKKFCMMHKEIYPGTNIIPYLREYAFKLDERMTGEEAWACFKNYNRGVLKEDREVFNKTLQAFDEKSFGQSLVSDEAIYRAQFIKLYNSFKERLTTETINAR